MFMDIRKEINIEKQFSLVQFCRSVSDSWQPVDRSMPGPPVHHQLPEFTQTHVHRVSDAIRIGVLALLSGLPINTQD